MSPHIGCNGVIIVSESVSCPGDFFADKQDNFLDCYDEYTLSHFECLTDKEWNQYMTYINVQLTVCRNYNNYADPKSVGLFYEISELFGEVIEKGLKRRITNKYVPHGNFDMQSLERL